MCYDYGGLISSARQCMRQSIAKTYAGSLHTKIFKMERTLVTDNTTIEIHQCAFRWDQSHINMKEGLQQGTETRLEICFSMCLVLLRAI
jgi:hypothetical protein